VSKLISGGVVRGRFSRGLRDNFVEALSSFFSSSSMSGYFNSSFGFS